MATKAKRFRIAVQGATTDGREISRDWISQMAKNYDPTVYGARVNMEHIKGYAADSTFRRFGDVTKVEAEEITEGPLAGKLALFGYIDPTPELVELTRARQKVYTSIEVNPKFSDTGEAYLIGLAVTDDPASLGTEYLSFSATARANPLASRKQDKENLFTAAEETLIEFYDEADAGPSLLSRVKELFTRKEKTDDERFSDVSAAVTAVAEQVQKNGENHSQQVTALEKTFSDRIAALELEAGKDREALSTLQETLAKTDGGFNRRPPATGGDNKGSVQTDC
ncbi:Phage capsid scaffolding protein (GPO) serine peptidase [Candidatus Pantoea symbiotica]|uniref:Phage capsid scaffolding protein (GPO) serine peptidase n=1 Tax=Candidatus Pantoea symbiotica TaxID=1884370 RepID=A0A1I3UVT4_9GAMM|nr:MULTISPECIES: GPO family capsid scaffolding protein [Pantoea]SFJ87040.1 Phage capsid scaffolding protein (GPO) serine peptidase [Pantoea symbiotica]SFU61317.1 Phage capsid scaffolding protein (GPO) serine peptidase [Pantoea sp. YR525]